MKKPFLIACLSLQLAVAAFIPSSPVQTFLFSEARAQQDSAPSADAMAWVLGTKLGIAAVGREAGANPQAIGNMLRSANVIGDALGTTVPGMPDAPAKHSSKFAAQLLHYLLSDTQPLAKFLARQHGQRAADLFEIAIKSSILGIVYAPGDEMGRSIADVIEARARRAGLAEGLWQPLVEAIRSDASYDQVKTLLFEMHGSVRNELMAS